MILSTWLMVTPQTVCYYLDVSNLKNKLPSIPIHTHLVTHVRFTFRTHHSIVKSFKRLRNLSFFWQVVTVGCLQSHVHLQHYLVKPNALAKEEFSFDLCITEIGKLLLDRLPIIWTPKINTKRNTRAWEWIPKRQMWSLCPEICLNILNKASL